MAMVLFYRSLNNQSKRYFQKLNVLVKIFCNKFLITIHVQMHIDEDFLSWIIKSHFQSAAVTQNL